MKKLALLALVLLSGVLIGHFSRVDTPPAWANDGVEGEVASPPSAADLNADGDVDVTDAVYLLRYLFQGGAAPVPCQVAPATTLIVTRHAEKDTGADPGLTPEGQLRAEQFARLVGSAHVDVMISSLRRRTIETLLPLAVEKQLTEEDLVQLNEIDEVVEHVRSLEPGSTVVLCHHSFTLHQIFDGLCVPGHDEIVISGSNYDNWFVIELPQHTAPRLHHFRYTELPEIEPPPEENP